MLVIFTPVQKSTRDRVFLTSTQILKRTTEQLKNLHYQMQDLKPCRQHSPPHKLMHCSLPAEFLLLPQGHTPSRVKTHVPGRRPQRLHTNS